MDKKVETVDEIIDHLTRLAAAYRKSYKFCSRTTAVLQVTTGLIGCSAALVLLPAIPIFVAFVGAVPPVVAILLNKLKIIEKKSILKMHHHKVKQILTSVRIEHVKDTEDAIVISDAYSRLMKLQTEKDYTVPFEMYMKEFKLNGYGSK